MNFTPCLGKHDRKRTPHFYATLTSATLPLEHRHGDQGVYLQEHHIRVTGGTGEGLLLLQLTRALQ